ncbi:DUF4166 domain-containing protein [Microbacterium sp. 13-71-7]|uniref:DUF4166 domain-containing protein n=1 Tax=Microbacterium sp. 13-71-7 TaxID=1970399 RepID=UPI000BCFDECE|nr:DUF4166 domain-containing protein [Microbacterium sp. 13-71-7]OZB83526.1 MAG: hypothetical protein B7X32_10135 [Microbacterium sp. 13-71-7]
MTRDPRSPYAVALGARGDELHPRLRTYFAAIPSGGVGVGHGVFERVGCRNPVVRALLGPALRVLQRRGAVYAGWAEDVPFTVRNRDGEGRSGERMLHLPGGDWTMRDRVRALPRGRVVDRLGSPGVLAAVFDVTTSDGALELRSTRVGVRLGRLRIRIPRCIAPRIRLVESADGDSGLQRVAVTVDLPLLGRIHEYAGTFRYAIEEDA